MDNYKFSSPKEEALEIAYQTRRRILVGNTTGGDAVSILRACLVIARNLNKEDTEWISQELSGYDESASLPSYRNVDCRYQIRGVYQKDSYKAEIWQGVHILASSFASDRCMWLLDEGKRINLSENRLMGIMSMIVDRCLFFLNNVISELQYGGIVEYLMEEIRRETDSKLAKLDQKITNETQSLFLNLSSNNPSDWNKVGHSCRKILMLLADKLFPARDEKYETKSGRNLEVGNSQFINRLIAFIDQKFGADERKLLSSETFLLEKYLRQIVEYDQMAEHKPLIEKFHANMIAIHTYLISSEILRHYQSYS
jgi:hypothetical protein